MTAVGDKRIFATQTLLLADGEVGRFDAAGEDFSLPVRVRFHSPRAGDEAGTWTWDDGVLNLDFTGWRRPSGGMVKAHKVGDVDGEPVAFTMAHQRIGSVNQVTLQFSLGGTYE